jgi:radical SAM superfamily enzyme YgiQ (UPF0313 family)
MPASRPFVALVGRRLPHNENLGLAYLRAALEQAGARVATHYVNDAGDLARAVTAILGAPPDVVGLSLADGGSAVLPLALGEALARAGFAGHVTCGGQFATLARDWLLERYGWLDSVVRFAGEVPLVELAARVARGEGAFGVPGVTTREGDGPPAPVLAEAPTALRPLRDELPEILGHPAAHLSASRGCRGRCHYCGPAALQTLERREGARAGIAPAALTAHGVGGVRRREVDAVADEMAELWHGRGVRYFYFVDEHLLPYAEEGALAFLSQWRAGLRARGVGALGIGAMLRADRLTPRVARAFAEVGLVRAFIGLELAGDDEARGFGRPAPTSRDLALLEVFAGAGVTTVSNLMLLHPDSTPATIRAGVDLLERLPAGVFEATRMMVYHGTRLHDRVAAEGRLVGNPLRYGYTFADPVMERFAEVFSRLRAEAFWDYSLAYRTHDAHLALALARRLHPERLRGDVEARLEGVRVEVNRLYVSGYRRALALAEAGGGFAEAGALVRALAEGARALGRELDGVEALLLAAAPGRTRMFAPMRAAAASVITFAVVATAPACGGKAVVDRYGSAGSGGGAADAGAHDAGAGGTLADGGAGGAAPDGSACPVPRPDPTPEQIQATLAKGDACYAGSVALSPAPPPALGFSFNANAGMIALVPCSTPGAQAAKKAAEDAAAAVLAAACMDTSSTPVSTYEQGGATSDAQKMVAALAPACGPLIHPQTQFDIVLDASGKVVTVQADPATQPIADCIMKALTGLTFPCLASFEVCPEYVIAE